MDGLLNDKSFENSANIGFVNGGKLGVRMTLEMFEHENNAWAAEVPVEVWTNVD